MNITDADFDILDLPWRASHLPIKGYAGESLGDLLCTMFEAQQELARKYLDIEERNGHWPTPPPEMWGELDDRAVQARIKDLSFRLIEELTEATACLKNRPHKTTFAATDVTHFREELSDALHYFMELLLTAGVSADELFKLYFLKLQVNEFRQRSVY